MRQQRLRAGAREYWGILDFRLAIPDFGTKYEVRITKEF